MNTYVGVDNEFLNKLEGQVIFRGYDYFIVNNKKTNIKNDVFGTKYIQYSNGMLNVHVFLFGDNSETQRDLQFKFENSNIDLVNEFFIRMGIKSSTSQIFEAINKSIYFEDFDARCKQYEINRQIRREKENKIRSSDTLSKICSPKAMIRRETGNDNKDTFDFINLEIPICISDYSKAMKFCKKNISELIEYGIDYLVNLKKFKRYNISPNYLKIDNITLTQQKILNILFSFKEV